MIDRLRRDLAVRKMAIVVAYLGSSILLLYPILASPVVADDFFNPFSQIDEAGPGLGSALGFGWDGATEGASFRIVGNFFGSGFNWLWLELSARLGISMTSVFAVTRYVVLVGSAASVAAFWTSASAAFGRRVPLRVTFPAVSLTLFGTLQIHSLWSNDPVASYPFAGYAGAAVGFLVMTAACRVVPNPSRGSVALAVAAAVFGVLYYEINVGAVVGGTLILACGAWEARRSDRGARALVISAATIACVPAAVLLYGRTVTGDQAPSYAGTTVRLGGAPTTFARGLASSMPGSAWRLSRDLLGGGIPLVFFSFAAVFAVVASVRWWSRSVEASTAAAPKLTVGTVGVGFAAVFYGCFALALQAVTVKVQDEAPRVGYVYTWYAMTSCVVALGLAVAVRAMIVRPRTDSGKGTLRFVAVSAGLTLLLIQNTVNWRLSERLTESYASNRWLLDAFDDEVPPVDRCAALANWDDVAWPLYYEEGVIGGLQEAFEHYFDEPFCEAYDLPD